MRWKALQFLGKLESNGKQTFGFKSTKCPPAIDELGPFESDLQRMISNIKFRPIRNKFLSKLSKGIKSIKKTKNSSSMLINLETSTKCLKKITKSICATTSQKRTKSLTESESVILALMLKKLRRS